MQWPMGDWSARKGKGGRDWGYTPAPPSLAELGLVRFDVPADGDRRGFWPDQQFGDCTPRCADGPVSHWGLRRGHPWSLGWR